MPSIHIESAKIQFTVYEIRGRSIRKDLLQIGIGGRMSEDEHNRVHVTALDQLTMSLNEGDRIGLVGRNGAGKTTLLRMIAGIYEPVEGRIEVKGSIAPLFDITMGTDPDSTGYENILLRGLFLGMTYEEIAARTPEIEEFSGLGKYLNLPMRTYSSGMQMRLAFSIVTSVKPEILLMDEIINVGDASFFVKAQEKLESFIGSSEILVLASHQENVLKRFCDKAALLHNGKIELIDDVDKVLREYNALS